MNTVKIELNDLLVLAKQAVLPDSTELPCPPCVGCSNPIGTDEIANGNGGRHEGCRPFCDSCAHEVVAELGQGVIFLIGEEQPYPNENAAQVLFRQGEHIGKLVRERDDAAEALEVTEGRNERLTQENTRLETRVQELLRDFQKLTREMPYAEEAQSNATLIAEVGTLKARVRELEQMIVDDRLKHLPL